MFARSKNVDFSIALENCPDSYVLIGDEEKLHVVMRNLITNALKYTPAGGKVTIRQIVKKLPEGTILQFEVSDTGVGIDLNSQKALFQEFSMGAIKQTQKHTASSGLGLWISRKIVQMHDGDITCYSAGINTGSTFTVQLPLYSKQDDDISQELRIRMPHNYPQTQKEPSVERSGSKYQNLEVALDVRILLVDDSVENCSIVKKQIHRFFRKKFGIAEYYLEIVTANDGTTALNAIDDYFKQNGRHFTYVLLDSCMMQMHGPEAAFRMKAIENFNAFIVGVTGNAHPDEVADFISNGADMVLSKPIDIEVLGQLLLEKNYLIFF
jgi:two-component system chemotaxis sensor kinase CheA